MAMTVMPICIVDRKRLGSRFNSRAMRAPSWPLSARFCSRALRAATIAISAIVKSALSSTRERRIAICSVSILGTHYSAGRSRNETSPRRGLVGGTTSTGLARIELDDEVGVDRHWIGDVGELGCAHEPALHSIGVDLEIIGHVALARLHGFEHDHHLLGLAAQLDRVVVLDLIGGDVDPSAVDRDMAVIDELARGEGGGDEFHPVDDGIEAALQEFDEVLAGVALAPRGLLVEATELTLADIAVIALELLLGHQLGAEIRGLLTALAVLAGTVVAAVQRTLRATPQIDADAPVYLVLGPVSFAHLIIPSCDFVVPVGPRARTGPSVF